MSKIAEYKALEASLAEQLKQLEALKNDNELKREIEFETKLRALMEKYGVNLRGIISILDPQPRVNVTVPTSRRSERKIKVYKHPKTGEVVETKGGNHKVLKSWKSEFGAEAVESWLQ
ncbi:transcriptional regulator [Pseudomonas sp. PA15(2017)]|uniref:histone-like nucleoid-structuring protein, MvaT/MvaU family n=1 Tax=Pseudomonas sp. PA15(2017) TaxID=1932111 RepID=UPI00095C7273|nr:histone-like nucleoid-structuring protein, MvaT/MvaU family [Pseudomonas sp. PA15(2017)]OLU25537.1 transcriptional regulator [Pseudomonas sp. PA15(2017)]